MARKSKPTFSAPKPAALRVALYTRVSTDLQANKEEGSLDTQEARLRAAVLSRAGNHTVTHVFREEGESGKSLDRPEMQRMMEAIKRNKIDLVIVTRLDRLSRSLLDFYELHSLFEEHNVQFVSLNETFDTSTAVGRAMLKLVLVFAELEREQTAERTRVAIQARAERGLWNGGSPPLGYNSLKQGKLEVDANEAELVRQIFQKYLELRSSFKVANWLNSQGLRQKRYSSRRKGPTGGTDFGIAVVRHILLNRLYLGEIEHKGEVYPGQHEAIIDRETFDRVRAIMDSNTVVPPAAREWAQYDYLLTGLLRCACGFALTTSAGRGNGGNYHYYRCVGVQKRIQQDCKVKLLRAPLIDTAVLSVVRDAARQPAMVNRAVAEANRMAQAGSDQVRTQVQGLKRDLLGAEQRATSMVSSIIVAGIGESATARRMLLEAEQQQEQLRAALAEAEARLELSEESQIDPQMVLEALRGFDEAFEHLTLEEKRELLGQMIREVKVYPDHVEVELYDGEGVSECFRQPVGGGGSGRGQSGGSTDGNETKQAKGNQAGVPASTAKLIPKQGLGAEQGLCSPERSDEDTQCIQTMPATSPQEGNQSGGEGKYANPMNIANDSRHLDMVCDENDQAPPDTRSG